VSILNSSSGGAHTGINSTVLSSNSSSSPMAAAQAQGGAGLEGMMASNQKDGAADGANFNGSGGGGGSTNSIGVSEGLPTTDRIRQSINLPAAPVLLDIPIFEVNLTL
jgi:hypothetical protein